MSNKDKTTLYQVWQAIKDHGYVILNVPQGEVQKWKKKLSAFKYRQMQLAGDERQMRLRIDQRGYEGRKAKLKVWLEEGQQEKGFDISIVEVGGEKPHKSHERKPTPYKRKQKNNVAQLPTGIVEADDVEDEAYAAIEEQLAEWREV